MIKNLINFLRIQKRKFKSKKISYSFNSVDLIIEYLFKKHSNGFYIDIGAQHPISNNNTYLLYKKGWSGINIDLDKSNIDLFNIARPNDLNINFALSDKEGETDYFYFHDGSPINSLNKEVSSHQKANYKEIKKIKTDKLDNILYQINFKKNIDYLNIDVEGHELFVLKGFNLSKYKPSIISVEYLDLNMKRLEFRNNNLKNITDSKIYRYLIENEYFFINWLHGDLIFAHKNFRD